MADELFEMQVYLLNSVFCAVILLFLYFRNLLSDNNAEYHRHFIRRLFYASVCAIAECAYAVLRLAGCTDPVPYYVTAAVFFISCTLHCYRCYRFDRRYVRFDAPHTSTVMRFVSKIPAACAVVMVLMSCMNGFVFSFDEDVLVYGPGFIVYLVMSYGYLVYSIFSAFRRYYRNDVISKGRFRQLLFLESVNVVLFVMRRFITNVPFAIIGVTLTSLLLYTLIVDATIVYDALTKVLAKESVNIVIERKIRWDTLFFVTIMDVDRFKRINDTFGHNEGDIVLKRLGGALNDVCRRHDATPGRIGGDEFCIISDSDPTPILADLQKDIDVINAGESRYVLSVSAGIYHRTQTDHAVNELISKADAEMYRVKTGKKEREQRQEALS